MAKKAAQDGPIQTTEQIRAAFEAGLRDGQRVHLRYAFHENNQVSGEQWYAAPGTRGIIDLIEPCPAGTLYWVAFRGRYTLEGEETVRRVCRAFSPSDLCAKEEEAIRG